MTTTEKPLPKFYIRRMTGMGGEPLFGAFKVERRLNNGHLWGSYVPFSSRRSVARVMDALILGYLLKEPKTRVKDRV